MTTKPFFRAAGAVVAAAIMTASAGGLAQAGPTFPAAVSKILMNQQDGPVSRLSASKKRELIACVNNVLVNMPNGNKRFVVSASSLDEMESRFGKVVMANRAEWKQKIARSCAHIAV